MAGGEQFIDMLSMGTKGRKGPTNAVRWTSDENGTVWVSVKGSPFVTLSSLLGGSPYFESSIDGRRGKYAARARALTGISDETLVNEQFTDLGVSYEYSFSGIAGGTSSPNIGGPGILRIVGGGAAQGGTINFPGFGTIFTTASIALKRWYLVFGWRVFSNQPNNLSRFYGLFSTGSMSGSVAIGFNGTVQTAKYAFSAPNADGAGTSPALNVLSTVAPVVGPWVVGEIWYDGSAVFGSINGESPVLVALPAVLPQNVATPPQFESRPAVGSVQTDAIDLDFMGMWMEQ
jgi:hypothetical protein